MRITNSFTGKKEEFKTIKENEVKIYACGITVYDLSHIGHARQAMVYDMITSYLRYKGYKVTYVRNYTDVDDKIINKANSLGITALELSQKQIEENEKDMLKLHVKEPDIKTKASEYIENIIKFVSELIEKGYAYVTEKGDVYFSVNKFSKYGNLSHRNVEEMLNGVRIELEEGKENPVDFAIWKSAKPGEIYWNSPWGEGRPGWHIECSTMILNTLGETIDIHGGGRDLLFPHHENEIAQSEALTGKRLANYWTHCGLIKINGEKMSKSLGNSLTIRDALKMYNYEVIKYLIHSKHYTTDIDIHDSDFKLSEAHIYYFYNTMHNMEDFIEKNGVKLDGEIINDDIVKNIVSKFEQSMDDDFNTVNAIANLHSIFKYINNIIKNVKENEKQKTANTLFKMYNDIKSVYSILGFFEQKPMNFIKEIRNKYLNILNINESEIKKKIEERLEAKKMGNYEKADSIRTELGEKGIILRDTKDVTQWDIKALYEI